MNLYDRGANGPILRPGAVIGMLGGGQLGRMTALAAAPLGFRTHVYCPEEDPPAAQVAADFTQADYGDEAALKRLAEAVDVVTCEFENVPAETLAILAEHVPVRPGPEVFRVAQDRLREKAAARRHEIACPPHAPVADRAGLDAAIEVVGLPAVLKTARLGYDGKGQARLDARADAAARDAAWARIGGDSLSSADGPPAILEAFVDFACELSAITARGLDGAMATFTPAENTHQDHVLHTSTVPPRVSPIVAARAKGVVESLAEGLGVVGLLAVELFVTPDGQVLFNEMAPRPHNSGHWTQDGCRTSQFEQFVRAVCGLPLGAVDRTHDVVMTNLVGEAVSAWETVLLEDDAKLHLYGKAETRPGRKMGHVNRLKSRQPPKGLTLGEEDPHGIP